MDFNIGLFEYREQKMFGIHWRCETHPHQNTASIKLKITTHYELFFFLFDLRMVSEQIFSQF